jgi:hypothetical protein
MVDNIFLPVVFSQHGERRSQRDVELQSARVKAHAARISWAGRRKTRGSLAVVAKRQHSAKSCQCEDPTAGCACRSTTIPLGTVTGSLARRDPFVSHVGHNLPSVCHQAVEFGK